MSSAEDSDDDATGVGPKRGITSSVRSFNFKNRNLAEEWRCWLIQFKVFLRAAGLDQEGNARKVALLLHYLGGDAIQIFSTFELDIETVNFSDLITKFEHHFKPSKNITANRFMFFNRKQASGESVEKFATELFNLAGSCEFDKLKDSLVKDILICNLHSSEIKERLLIEDPADLATAVKLVQAIVASKDQASLMISEAEVHAVQSSKNFKPPLFASKAPRNQPLRGQDTFTEQRKRLCGYCGSSHPPRKCPAYNQICKLCGKPNHYAKVCRQRYVHNVAAEAEENDDDDDDEFFIGNIDVQVKSQPWYEAIYFNNRRLMCQIDTGAQVNLISKSLFQKIGYNLSDLEPSRATLKTLAGVLPVLGCCIIDCTYRMKLYKFKFFVVDLECQTIISLRSAEQLKLVNRNITGITSHVNEVHNISLEQYRDLFDGLGCVKDIKVTLDVDPKVKPKIDPPRKIPIKLRERFRAELTRMIELGVITKMDKPASWVSSVVVVEKGDNKVRVCIDPRNLNEAIIRPRRYIPQLEEIKAELSDAGWFSTLDANSGFWILPLDEKSSDLTCFNTPFGRFKFLRLPFGISASSEIFQDVIAKLFEGIPGLIIYIDDFLIYGKTEKEHDERLQLVLKRARDVGLKFNEAKCQIKKSSVKYLGHIFGKEGVSIDPSRIEAIEKMESPRSKVELQRFLGLINYIHSFIKNLSIENSNLRKLLKVNVPWHWNESLEAEFQKLKKLICEAPVLRYFDPKKPVKLSVDSSSTALGAVIMQEDLPIAYASSTLSDCQTRWAQIEKELLAIWFACKKFNSYLYGQDIVTVETDHKPLVSIFKKDFDKIPSRLQRLMMKLYKYHLNVVYTPGKNMFISDTLSRAHYRDGCMDDSKMIEKELNFQVNLLFSSLSISDAKLKAIQEETAIDKCLQEVSLYCQQGWPNSKTQCTAQTKPYFNIRDELSVCRGVVFRGPRIVIPLSMKKDLLKKIHEGHFGFEKCYRMARDVMFWPNFRTDIKNVVENCEICLKHKNRPPRQPLLQHEPISVPFGKVAVDLADFDNKKLIVLVDYYSGFFEYSFLNSTTATVVIKYLKSMFSRWGIPFEVFSDNGPPFTSREMINFAKEWGFKLTTSSPNFSRSNGCVERAIQTVKKILLKAEDPYMALLKYRTTAKCPMSYSPSQLLMSRQLRTNLPCTEEYLRPKVVDVKKYSFELDEYKKNVASYYDRHARLLPDLEIGKEGLFKKQPNLPWSPCKIIAKCPEPRSYLVKQGNGIYRRNREHILPGPVHKSDATACTNVHVKASDQTLFENTHQQGGSGLDRQDSPNNAERVEPENLVAQPLLPYAHTRSGRVVKPPRRFTFSKTP